MASNEDAPLDEVQWSSPPVLQAMGGTIHTNTGKISQRTNPQRSLTILNDPLSSSLFLKFSLFRCNIK